MATTTVDDRRARVGRQSDATVIFASSLGTVFEWYDFYIYGTLGAILASKFFSGVAPTSAFIFTLLAFAAGFAVRPFGALVFGRLGDLVGRKYTFLVTMTLMGIGTFLIGVLPTYASIGIAAPILLIVLRLVQGLALGGEYGGAATYVAEHAPQGKRGLYTSWIQTTATLGLFMALLVILGIRTVMGEAAFNDWGWRIPFLLSVVLLGVSIWIRLQLAESPAFQRMKDEGKQSKAPLKEAFGNWANAKIAILALLGATAGEAVVWYGGQFYALFFLTQTIKVPAVDAQIMIVIALAIANAVLHRLRLALRQDRPQADHDGGLPARGRDLLPDLPGHHALRQPGAREGAGGIAGDGRGRSGAVLVPAQADRHRAVHQAVRRREVRAGRALGELHQRDGGGGRAHRGEGRQRELHRRHAGLREEPQRRDHQPRLPGLG